MMNEFWTTVLSTAGAAACASAIVSGVITSVASIWIQHIYDRKLEEHKAEVQKKIDEHQIQFKYWYDEKAKAIKELHSNAGELFYSLCTLHVIESKGPQQWDSNKREEAENELKKQICLKMQTTINEWIKLRLFLNDNEDSVF